MKFSILNFQFSKIFPVKNSFRYPKTYQKGQALISLLFFMIIGITLITAASFVTLENVSSTSAAEQGTLAYYNAESGIEDALLQLLRYPCASTSPYPACTTSNYNEGSALITINSSSNSLTITSVGSYGQAIRKIQVVETNGSSGWQITSWQEIN
jgi:Tfp pilus assembly protein PilX